MTTHNTWCAPRTIAPSVNITNVYTSLIKNTSHEKRKRKRQATRANENLKKEQEEDYGPGAH